MKRPVDIKRIQLYLWIGLAFLFLRVLGEFHEHRDMFFQRLLDNTWRGIFLIVVNYFLFEGSKKVFQSNSLSLHIIYFLEVLVKPKRS